MWGKLALIQSEYGALHLFNGVDDEELAHGVYRWIIEDLYDNEEARCAQDFGPGVIGHEELQGSWEQEGEGGTAGA
jgi:hypothetical protein